MSALITNDVAKADKGDYRLLESLFEVLRKNPNDYVNINLQNKAEYANLPFVEVPEN